jgi:hypothetical protein
MRMQIWAAAALLIVNCASAVHATVLEGPASRAVAILVDELRQEGFKDVTVSQRIFGGYVIEAESGNAAVLLSLNARDFSPETIETFSKDVQTGFFGTVTRPVDGTVQSIISRYTTRLATAEDAGPNINLTEFLRDTASPPITAGFTQERAINFSENSVVIRQTETLGILSPVITVTTTSTETQRNERSTTTQNVDHRVTYSTQQSEAVIHLSGTTAFDASLFASPDSIRDTIAQNIVSEVSVIPPAGIGVSQDALINQIVTSTEALAGKLPNGLPKGFPSNLRDNINLILNPLD